jgi:hypothetical protein
VISYRDNIPNTTGNMKVLSAESIIPLSSYKNIESITINYRLEQNSEIITYEVIGSVIDGKDGESPVSQFVANVFCRTNENLAYELYAPSGGVYDNPLLGLTSLKIPDKFDRNKETTLYTF